MTLCGRKTKYDAAWQAKRAMKRLRDKGRVLGECDAYQCKTCGGWHWGHKRGTQVDRAQQTINAIDRALARDAARRAK